jgi:hypothetical protein
MKGVGAKELAADPVPEDAAVDVLRDTMLKWEAGEFAATHDLYFGTVFDDVNNADSANPGDVLVSQNQGTTSYDVGVLAFGQTYYWCVDEVNSAPDNTVFKGEVWSFTVEPYSIPVEAITVTASSSQADMGPENTINGIGLNALDQHSTEGTEMWLSATGDQDVWIQYEFDKAYKLYEMWVWNSNQLIEAFVGLGVKDVIIEISADGANWTQVEDAPSLAQAAGSPTYMANTAVDFGGAMAQYVKISGQSGYGPLGQYGLSEVRFLYIPTFAREPQPVEGDTTEGANVTLSWRAGREAASHQVYLGTDAENLPLVGTVEESRYDAGALDYDITYYWQIVEVNEAETPTWHAGIVWSFATPAFGIVDDFESYDDDYGRIFFAWLDGVGHNGSEECGVGPYNGNGSGSIVGHAGSPFAEQTIVHSGGQSMPLEYDSGVSETTISLNGQDWTASRIQLLSVYIYGALDNTGQLYVKINDTKLAYDGDPGDTTKEQWQQWNIDLTTLDGLQNVTTFTIGVDGTRANGTIYIDDIRLYP